jgi:hypothetical protein
MQFQHLGGAEFHALWLFSAAQVAFDCHFFVWVDDDSSERAGLYAGATTYAKFFVDEHEVIGFTDCSSRAGISTRGLCALYTDNRVISNRFFFDDPNAAGPYSKFFIMGVHTSSNTCRATGTTFTCIYDLRHSCTFINRSDGCMPLKGFREVSVLGLLRWFYKIEMPNKIGG